MVFGPHVSNVVEAAEYIVRCNYGARIEAAHELCSLVERVIRTEVEFSTKTNADLKASSTALAGTYILDKLRHD